MKTETSRASKSNAANEAKTGKRRQVSLAYPFSALVGQEEMKLALILNVIDPSIGGVLLMGHRGTGKSTAVRALANLLPEIEVVPGCPYRCDPDNEKVLCAHCKEGMAAERKLRRQRSR